MQDESEMGQRLLLEGEVAHFLGVSLACLRRWRWERRGPAYIKAGRLVRYDLNDLQDWVESRKCSGGRS